MCAVLALVEGFALVVGTGLFLIERHARIRTERMTVRAVRSAGLRVPQ